MPRFCLTFVSLLAFLSAVRSLAQAADDLKFEPLHFCDDALQLPSAGPSPQATPSQGSGPVSEKPPPGKLVTLDKSAEAAPVATLYDFLGYRYASSSLDWIPGTGDQFGMFSIVWDHYIKSGIENGIGIGMGFHSLSGPDQTDMPAWVFDFSIGYQFRQRWGPIACDLATAVCASSDFKGNARARASSFPVTPWAS
ncbi:MAG: hypothetical protein WCB27_05075 [Thermoguttaceae bacterium]